MNLNDFCRRVPDVGRYLTGITPHNAKEFIGKPSDPQTKAMREREEEPQHYGFHGSKLADALSRIEPQIRLYRTRVNDPQNNKDAAVLEQLQVVYNRLTTTRDLMFIALRMALSVSLCRSMELPDVTVPVDDKEPTGDQVNLLDKRVRIKEGVHQRLLDSPPGMRNYWLKQYANEVYRLSSIQRGPGLLDIDGSEFLKDEGVSAEPDYGLSPAEEAVAAASSPSAVAVAAPKKK